MVILFPRLAQHRGSFIRRHKDPGNHWEGRRLLYSLSASFPSPDIQDDSSSGKLFSTHLPRKRFIISQLLFYGEIPNENSKILVHS